MSSVVVVVCLWHECMMAKWPQLRSHFSLKSSLLLHGFASYIDCEIRRGSLEQNYRLNLRPNFHRPQKVISFHLASFYYKYKPHAHVYKSWTGLLCWLRNIFQVLKDYVFSIQTSHLDMDHAWIYHTCKHCLQSRTLEIILGKFWFHNYPLTRQHY